MPNSVLDTLPLQLAILDPDGTILDVNETWTAESLDESVGAFDPVGENYLDVAAAGDEVGREVAAGLRELLAGKRETFDAEYPCHGRAEGERRWYHLRAAAFEERGERYATVMHADVTERKLAQLAAERRADELARERRQLSLLNQLIRHDLRNDLNLVLGWGGQLESDVTGDGESALTRVLDAATHAYELTETIRDAMELLERSDAEPELRPTNLGAVLRREMESLRSTHESRTTDVEVRGLSELPEGVFVLATPLLASLFGNLLSNAVHHNDEKRVVVEVSVETGDGTATVSVADNGPGIPEEIASEMFDRGSRGLDSSSTGLGLFLVDSLVDLYGGRIGVRDNHPKGTVFDVELPTA
ncbi:PAS domain-containing sensor histidine kinase [Halopelagius inordinatus]|uniref:PAS domain-containing sensor histidine kinase n=1 Tax=Halopelagius inordinatus TaxID=553467 RepID=UPI0015A605F6|nr:PAS domain-containing sensor histidine kinase [Halopelagius inordinatus]